MECRWYGPAALLPASAPCFLAALALSLVRGSLLVPPRYCSIRNAGRLARENKDADAAFPTDVRHTRQTSGTGVSLGRLQAAYAPCIARPSRRRRFLTALARFANLILQVMGGCTGKGLQEHDDKNAALSTCFVPADPRLPRVRPPLLQCRVKWFL